MNVEGTICVKHRTSKYGLDIQFFKGSFMNAISYRDLILVVKHSKNEHKGIEIM